MLLRAGESYGRIKVTWYSSEIRCPPDETGKGKSDYFLDSADRIHFFIEKSAADKDPNVNACCEVPEGLNSLVYTGIIGN